MVIAAVSRNKNSKLCALAADLIVSHTRHNTGTRAVRLDMGPCLCRHLLRAQALGPAFGGVACRDVFDDGGAAVASKAHHNHSHGHHGHYSDCSNACCQQRADSSAVRSSSRDMLM